MSRQEGLLVYQAEDLRRNRWFAETLCHYAESEGLSLRLCLCAEAQQAAEKADFVINRSRDAQLSQLCESRGIRVFNSAQVTAVTNDKYCTDRFLCAHGLPTAPTELIAAEGQIPEMPFPMVAKPLDGHGGADVIWAENAGALRGLSVPYLVQQPMQTGWDMRVYILGNRIYRAVLRTSDTDFRSNFSLGGHASLVEPDADAQALVSRVTAVLPIDFAGIDLLRNRAGEYVIGEIEDAVGCRMLYDLTDLDAAKDYMHYIAAQLK